MAFQSPLLPEVSDPGGTACGVSHQKVQHCWIINPLISSESPRSEVKWVLFCPFQSTTADFSADSSFCTPTDCHAKKPIPPTPRVSDSDAGQPGIIESSDSGNVAGRCSPAIPANGQQWLCRSGIGCLDCAVFDRPATYQSVQYGPVQDRR